MNLNAHALTSYDYRNTLLKHLVSNPGIKFADLNLGLYYYADHSRPQILSINKISPGKRKIDAFIFGFKNGVKTQGESLPIYAGERYYLFHPISQETLALCCRTHRGLVKEATKDGVSIPVEVKREYPDLFVSIPERFAPEDVQRCLTGWGRLVTVDDVEKAIETTRVSIRHHDDDAAYLVTFGQRGAEESRKARANLLDKLALYLWVLSLVSSGGIFAIDKLENP